MSFSLEFYAASAEDAAKILAEEKYVPQSVRDFITFGLNGCKGAAYVKASGHLYNGDYQVSTAMLEIRPVDFRAPKG